MRFFLSLTTLCFALTASGQDYDFGEVSKEELQEAFNITDSTASACYLYKYRKTYINYNQQEGFQLITEVHERVKVYSKEGFEQATRAILLYKEGADEEEIKNIKAYTFNLEGSKIVETKLEKKGIFKTEKSKYLNEVKFTMPNVNEGSVLEYKYKVLSPFITSIDEFVFQEDIPIKKLEGRFESPEYFQFKVNSKGYRPVAPTTKSTKERINLSTKTRSNDGLHRVKTSYDYSQVEYTNNIHTYSLSNIPALKEEPFVNNIDNYRSSIKYELSFTNFPNSPVKNYSTTWEDVVKTIYKSSSFGDELSKVGYYKDDIDALIGHTSNSVERAALIYNFVKKKVKWNGYYGYLVDEGVRKAYKDQAGNVAEINLMLTSMLNYAGVTAYPVLVSTRQHGVPLFPTRKGYNYIICYVKDSDKSYLLDATSPYSLPNVLPFRTLNWQGRVITERGNSTFISLYPNSISKNDYSVLVNIDEAGQISGGCRSVKTGHSALLYRMGYNDQDKDQYLEDFENKYDGLEVSDFTVKNENDLSKPIMESYKFVKEAQADIVGDKMYFAPMFYLKMNENPFKLEQRDYPIDFGYPSKNVYKITINVPEGYKVDILPEPKAVSLPDNLGYFKYNVQESNGRIQVIVTTQISTSIVTPDYYETLKMYISQLIEKESEQVVLSKV